MRTALLVLLPAMNPVAVAAVLRGRVADRRLLATALAVTLAVVVVAAALSEPVLDLLSVSAPTFRIAAGAVLGLAGAVWVVRGPRPLAIEDQMLDEGPRTLAVPLLVPVLLTPQLVATTISVGADEGVLPTAVAAAIAAAATLAVTVGYRGRAGVWSAAVRLTGLLATAVAFGLVVDGIKSV